MPDKQSDLNDYQTSAAQTAVYPKAGKTVQILYCALGLAGEAGEVANKVKKLYRDDRGELTEQRRAEIADELGDCLWYIAMLALELDTRLSDIAARNLAKLRQRRIGGSLHGDGDKR